MIRTAFLLAMAAVVATPAAAGAPASQDQAAAKPAKPEDKVVCRFVNSTGSRLGREKECKTRAQWDRESEETQDDIARQSARATGDAMNGPH
jgi:hypothetical protein